MSNDEYQHKLYWDKPICIEKDSEGKCVMSMKFTTLDISKPVPFCKTVKIKRNANKNT